MNQSEYDSTKGSIRHNACALRASGVRNSRIGEALNLTHDQYRDLFKPPYRERRRRLIPIMVGAQNKKRVRPPSKSMKPLELLKKRVHRFMGKGILNQRFTAQDVVAKFGHHPVCYLTGSPIDYEVAGSFELDHFVPLSKGGTSDLNNLKLASPMANRMKNGHHFDEFLRLCRAIVAFQH